MNANGIYHWRLRFSSLKKSTITTTTYHLILFKIYRLFFKRCPLYPLTFSLFCIMFMLKTDPISKEISSAWTIFMTGRNGINKNCQHEKHFQFKKCQTWCSPSISHHPSQVNRIYLNSNDIPHQQYISNEEWTDTKSINVRYLRIVDKL